MIEKGSSLAQVCSLSIGDQSGDQLLTDINLSVRPSRPLFILGPSGAGKSMIVRTIFGALPKELGVSGHFIWRGTKPISFNNVNELHRFRGGKLAILPQNARASLDPTMRLSGQLITSDQKAALKAVDLSAEVLFSYPFMLSGGMVQRFSIASALSQGAKLIVADEPTKGLDAYRRDLVLDLLQRTLDLGHSLIVVTHDPSCLRHLGGDAAVIVKGKVVEKTTSRRLLCSPEHKFSREWVAAEPRNWPARLPIEVGSKSLIDARGLQFSYKKGQSLFSNLNIRVKMGQIIGLLGNSGSGKSTLGNILLGLAKPRRGSVNWLDGIDAFGRSASKLRRFYQKLHQDPISSFNPYRRIGQQFSDLEKLVPTINLKQEINQLCERLHIEEHLLNRFPNELSGGEGQRLALARILILAPKLIVADEPTSQLDPVLQREVMLLLRDVVIERKIGLILIGHDKALFDAVVSDTISLGS